MRVSLIGALRNASRELYDLQAERQANEYEDVDYSGMHAYVLDEIATNLEELEANPDLLGEFAQIYCLDNLRAALIAAERTAPVPTQAASHEQNPISPEQSNQSGKGE